MPVVLLVVLIAVAVYCRHRSRRAYAANTVGFLHPSAGAGGGGERVLWVALDRIQRADVARHVQREYVVFTNAYGCESADAGSPSEAPLLARVAEQFHISLCRPVRCVYLRGRMTQFLDGSTYPCLTLLLQTVLGGTLLFVECALWRPVTPLVLETVGVPMVYPLLRVLAGCRVVAYTHYPVVTSVMRERVWSGGGGSAGARLYRCLKCAYYQAFTLLYRLLGQFPALVFTNSSWTQAHLARLYWPRTTVRLYAPCDVQALAAASRPPAQRNSDIVSVGQYRPEKNHSLQLRAFHQAAPRLPPDARLVLVGGARNEGDQGRVQKLTEEAAALGIADRVLFRVNVPYTEVHARLSHCCIGLHTMLDEHLGIVVLEYLAAGCVPLAHRSGGVELDIVNSAALGFLARTQDEYAEAMITICAMRRDDPDAYRAYQCAGAQHVKQFSDEVFGAELTRHMGSLLYGD